VLFTPVVGSPGDHAEDGTQRARQLHPGVVASRQPGLHFRVGSQYIGQLGNPDFGTQHPQQPSFPDASSIPLLQLGFVGRHTSATGQSPNVSATTERPRERKRAGKRMSFIAACETVIDIHGRRRKGDLLCAAEVGCFWRSTTEIYCFILSIPEVSLLLLRNVISSS